MHKYRDKKERRRTENFIFPTGEGEATNPEKMEDLYESIHSWGMEEEDGIDFYKLG